MFGKFFHWQTFLKGFASGGIMAGGILLQSSFAVQALLFIFGLLMFLDTIIPGKLEVYPILSIIGLVLGIIACAVLVFYSSIWYPAAVVLLSGIYYIKKICKKALNRKKHT